MGWYLRPGISRGQWFYTQGWCSMMISWLNHVLLRWLWFSKCHCWCISVMRSAPLLRGFSVIFSFSVITKYAIIYASAQLWPIFGFSVPWHAPISLWAASFWHTGYCLSCVGIFFYPSFFCLLSGMFYSCILVHFPSLPVLFLPNL